MSKQAPQKGSPLPDCDHVLRYIGPRHVDNGVVNGAGFLARPMEVAASVNWLEWFDPPVEEQVVGVRSLTRLNYAKSGKLVRLNVGHTARYVRENDPNGLILTFVHDPLDECGAHPPDPTHSLIKGVPMQDTPEAALVKDLIADCILPPIFPAVTPAGPAKV